jgi:YD repeat-containing protein
VVDTPSGNRITQTVDRVQGGGWFELWRDRHGSVLRTFDSLGQLVSVSDQNVGRPGSYGKYDDQGNLVQMSLNDGAEWKITPDSWGAPERLEGPFGETTTINRTNDNLIDTLSLSGGITRMSMHDTAGRLVKETAGWDPSTSIPGHGFSAPWEERGYDDQGNPASHADADRLVRRYRRLYGLANADSPAAAPPGYREIVDEGGKTTVFGWNPDGTLAFRDEQNGDKLFLEYDAVGRVIRSRNSDRFIRYTIYDDRDRIKIQFLAFSPEPTVEVVLSTTKFDWNDTTRMLTRTDDAGLTSYVTYDERDRTRLVWNGKLDKDTPERVFEWDDQDRIKLIRELVQRNHVTSREWRYSYDDVKRTVTITDPIGRKRTSTLDALGRPTELVAGPERQKLAWSADGRAVTRTDPLGRQSHLDLDARGRVARVRLPQATTGRRAAEPSSVVEFQWSAGGRVLSRITPDGAIWPAFFDEEGRLTGTAPPGTAPGRRVAIPGQEGPLLPAPPDEPAPGLFVVKREQGGFTASLGELEFHFSQDRGNDKDTSTVSDGVSEVTVRADHNPRQRSVVVTAVVKQPDTQSAAGLSAWPSGRSTYQREATLTYDELGRLSKVEQTEPYESTISREYDDAGRLALLRVDWEAPSGFASEKLEIRYEYDDTGAVVAVKTQSHRRGPTLTLVRDEVGQVRVRTTAPVDPARHWKDLGDEQTEPGRAEERLSYDDLGRVKRRSAGLPFCIVTPSLDSIGPEWVTPENGARWLLQFEASCPGGLVEDPDAAEPSEPHCVRYAYPRQEERYGYDAGGRLETWTVCPRRVVWRQPYDGDLTRVDAWPHHMIFEEETTPYVYDHLDRPGSADDYDDSGNRQANGTQGPDHTRRDWSYDMAGRPTHPNWSWDASSRIARVGEVHFERGVFGGVDAVRAPRWSTSANDQGPGYEKRFDAWLLWDPELGLLGVRELAERKPDDGGPTKHRRREVWVIPEGPNRAGMILVSEPQDGQAGDEVTFLRAGGAWVDEAGRATAPYGGDIGTLPVYGWDNKVVEYPFGATAPALPFALLEAIPLPHPADGGPKHLGTPRDWMQICSPASRIWLSEERQFAHPKIMNPEGFTGLEHRYQEFFGAPSPYLAAEAFMPPPPTRTLDKLPELVPQVAGEDWLSWGIDVGVGTGIQAGVIVVATGLGWPLWAPLGVLTAYGLFQGARSRRELSEQYSGEPISWLRATGEAVIEGGLDMPLAAVAMFSGTDVLNRDVEYSDKARLQRVLGAFVDWGISNRLTRRAEHLGRTAYAAQTYGDPRVHDGHSLGLAATFRDMGTMVSFLAKYQGMMTGNTLVASRARTHADHVFLARYQACARTNGKPRNHAADYDPFYVEKKIYKEVFVQMGSPEAIPTPHHPYKNAKEDIEMHATRAPTRKLLEQGYRGLVAIDEIGPDGAIRPVLLDHRRLYKLSDIREHGIPLRAWLNDYAYSFRLRAMNLSRALRASYTHGAVWNPKKGAGGLSGDLDMALSHLPDIISGQPEEIHLRMAEELNASLGLVLADSIAGATSMIFPDYDGKGTDIHMTKFLQISGPMYDPKAKKFRYRDAQPYAKIFRNSTLDEVLLWLSLYDADFFP